MLIENLKFYYRYLVNRFSKYPIIYNNSFNLQKILNHFHIRIGEKLENPTFGTIIWDVLFEPMTDSIKKAVLDNVTQIINYDPRVNASNIVVDAYESGIQIYAELTYIEYNISEQMTLKFDNQSNAIL